MWLILFQLLNFGMRQNGKIVGDVELPPWASGMHTHTHTHTYRVRYIDGITGVCDSAGITLGDFIKNLWFTWLKSISCTNEYYYRKVFTLTS